MEFFLDLPCMQFFLDRPWIIFESSMHFFLDRTWIYIPDRPWIYFSRSTINFSGSAILDRSWIFFWADHAFFLDRPCIFSGIVFYHIYIYICIYSLLLPSLHKEIESISLNSAYATYWRNLIFVRKMALANDSG